MVYTIVEVEADDELVIINVFPLHSCVSGLDELDRFVTRASQSMNQSLQQSMNQSTLITIIVGQMYF